MSTSVSFDDEEVESCNVGGSDSEEKVSRRGLVEGDDKEVSEVVFDITRGLFGDNGDSDMPEG